MMAKKIKIYIKTGKFSFPIPALRLGIIKWIIKLIIKYSPPKSKNNKSTPNKGAVIANFLKKMNSEDVDYIIENLKAMEPFELLNVEAYDENNEKIVVKIYTL
ncbi:hypothetical protein [Methanobacterium alcaliphilum]|uniref:hypothetical protein n=1 Tax=Methanobacterium alcaliphilum TaxID=392018 RepID=UPI00200B9F80|nr:hypothetical protein [Methanobacterium alcaliphilum]MCK9152357.1 hypothetical protein [Methanobacterium alcaliphilum]